MIAELVSVVAVFLGGCLFVRAAGLTGWAVPGFGLVAGLCIQLTVGLVQVVAHLPTSPVLTLALTLGLPAGWWLLRWWRGHPVTVPLAQAGLAVAAVLLAVPVLRAANLVKFHTDSFTYLMGGALLADGTYHAAVSTHHMTKRLLGVSVMHAPAQLAGEYYLRSITALLAVATVLILVWFFREGTRDRLDPTRLVLFGTLGGLLLVSNNRFIFSAFYVNGHLLVAALVLVIAGSGWLLLRDHPRHSSALMALQLLAIPALVVTRPEASVLAGVALLPMLLSDRVPLRHRVAATLVLGGSTVAWQALVVWAHLDRGAEVPLTVAGPLAFGVLLLPGAWLLRWTRLRPRGTAVLWACEAGLWLALGAFALRDHRILVESVDATVENLVAGAGKWGSSLVILTALVLLALVFTRSDDLTALRFPVTVFLPLALLEAYVRDAAYRVGYGDSLSRMFMHVVPLAVLYVMSAAATADLASQPARVQAQEG